MSRSRARSGAAARRGAGDELRHHHVLEGGEFRQQMVELVDEADADAADAGARLVVELRAVLPGDQHLARGRRLEQARDVQERRLARARLADQRHDLARVD